ncbi:TetR/AcrR family transcriptional regulator [Amnibacterium endophyticum]|uniref:TetR/AcrR family transcriptional regulator n=1 Tax=Amnibacterium endophyticum TaxID=2109337 RepID=A0ABW4LHU7_9MICO
MARWAEGGGERLQLAAMQLFQERGYDAVTVAEIAERAGLTKRSFFNHFADKREVLFAGAAALQAEVVQHIRAGGADEVAMDAALSGLAKAGEGLADYLEHAAARHALLVASPELLERDAFKNASMADVIAQALEERGTPPRTAHLTARTAVLIFNTAFADWASNPDVDFGFHLDQARADLIGAVS